MGLKKIWAVPLSKCLILARKFKHLDLSVILKKIVRNIILQNETFLCIFKYWVWAAWFATYFFFSRIPLFFICSLSFTICFTTLQQSSNAPWNSITNSVQKLIWGFVMVNLSNSPVVRLHFELGSILTLGGREARRVRCTSRYIGHENTLCCYHYPTRRPRRPIYWQHLLTTTCHLSSGKSWVTLVHSHAHIDDY